MERYERSPETPLQEGESQALVKFKKWLATEAEFSARTDEVYLLIFLRSCDFDLELTKQTMTSYYQNRVKVPQWWADRDLRDPQIRPLIYHRVCTPLKDNDPSNPLIVITSMSKFETRSARNFDNYFKLMSIIVEAQMRRRSSQMNGVVWIDDCRKYPWWLAVKFLSPFNARNVISTFYMSLPIKIKKIILLNAPPVAFAFHKLIQPFLSQSLKDRFIYFGTDWSKLSEHVNVDQLPVEYGGANGTLFEHEEAFIKELLEMEDYIAEDNNYGYQT